MRTIALAAVTTAVVLSAPLADAGETLRWKWAPGESSRLVMQQTMNMTMNGGPMGKINSSTDQTMLMTWTVGDSAGDATPVSQSMDRIVMTMDGPMGQGFTYDSAAAEAPVGMAAMVAPMFDALVKADITLAVSPRGEVSEVTLPDELKDAFNRVPGGAMSTDMVTQLTQQSMLKFPEQPLEVGDTWTETTKVSSPQMGAMQINVTYRYDGQREVDGRPVAAITPSLTMQVADPNAQAMPVTFETRASSGEILFDNEAGRLISSRIDQTTDVVVSVQGNEMRNEIAQTTVVRLLKEGETPDLNGAADDEAADEASLANPAMVTP
ncbi:MAG: DUF6263 family protein [Planctomycetota bacterium]